ncbi:MAG: hypothetical protein ABIE70_11420 [bacterium]
MKSNRLIAVMMLLSFGFACFFSAPALHAEDPWDVDNADAGGGRLGGSGGVNPGDTTVVIEPQPEDPLGSVAPGGTGWLQRLLWEVSLDVAMHLISCFEETPATGNSVASTVGGDSAAR